MLQEAARVWHPCYVAWCGGASQLVGLLLGLVLQLLRELEGWRACILPGLVDNSKHVIAQLACLRGSRRGEGDVERGTQSALFCLRASIVSGLYVTASFTSMG